MPLICKECGSEVDALPQWKPLVSSCIPTARRLPLLWIKNDQTGAIWLAKPTDIALGEDDQKVCGWRVYFAVTDGDDDPMYATHWMAVTEVFEWLQGKATRVK